MSDGIRVSSHALANLEVRLCKLQELRRCPLRQGCLDWVAQAGGACPTRVGKSGVAIPGARPLTSRMRRQTLPPPNTVLLLMVGLALLARPQQKTTFGGREELRHEDSVPGLRWRPE